MSEVITRAHLLSNGEYGVLMTGAGGGFSALRGYALTRWQPDPTTETQGISYYLRDLESGVHWSLGNCALAKRGDHIEQHCDNEGIEASCTIGVLASINAEIRRFRITNHSDRVRRIELTTYAELALNTPAADAAHPAFAKLFVQTGYDAQRKALLAWRRLRSPDDRALWMAQRLTGANGLQFETDRARFIGRTRSAANPVALATNEALSGSLGAVLDPIFSMRVHIELQPNQSKQLELFICAAATREEIEGMLDAEQSCSFASRDDARVLGLPKKWLAHIDLESAQPTACRHGGPTNGAEGQPEPRPCFGDFNDSTDDGDEYLLQVGPQLQPTPQPWINVVANEQFGFLISETGAGYTWAANSRENRITPWSNDAVTDPHTEAVYLRDDEDGSFWSALPGPAPADTAYEVRHGFGYTVFSHSAHDLTTAATLFVPRHDPVKLMRLRIRNDSKRNRKLSIVSYAQLVLGSIPAETRGAVRTNLEAGVIFARNPERGEFSGRVAFATAVSSLAAEQSATTSRREFIGEGGTLAQPAALKARALNGGFGSDLDPCAAIQLSVSIDAGRTSDVVFLLGEAEDEPTARATLARYKTVADADVELTRVKDFWKQLVGTVRISTPSRALDVMFNGWLAYQNLACRMWARSAFYQSGGAFGFRDQLQDSSALVYLDPQITRRQILLHAAHQFVEGDVLHWWHPPTGKGIRTRFSDDLLWLPQITCFYIARTGDRAILDEDVRFITAQALREDEDEIFVWPEDSGESATLYEHCCRAIDRSLTTGAHGLPLMGVGDWNDGMNRVGRGGRGESVWLGFFLFDILMNWIPLCDSRGDTERAERYRAYQEELHTALNDAGWDGGWYRRAYYDDGTPLGSAHSDECRIDALAQAWAVLSGVASAQRAGQAMSAMQEHLVDEQNGIIRLLTPAFDKTPHDPGYIKGYVPGVRENGGQYTHAALWAVRALAEHGESERAAPLLEMISPITRAAHPERYRGEPYVIAADVYGEPPHVGRAGWTWYTGSAGWMYRVLLESILGFELVEEKLIRLRPCIPRSWPGFSLVYRFPDGTTYGLDVQRVDRISATSLGEIKDGAVEIPVTLNGEVHNVKIEAGDDVRPSYEPRSSAAPLLRTTSR